MLDYLTAHQISEWEAFERLDPVNNLKEDIRLAYLIASITNIAIGVHGKRGTQMKQLTDFLLDWDPAGRPDKKQSPEEMLNLFKGIAMSQKQAAERKKKIEERKKKAEERKQQKNKKP